MDIFPAILIIPVIGGIVAIDTASAWQIMISQPVVICPAIGWLFGQPEIGITFGILLELPWLINIPSGGKHASDSNLAAVVATGLGVYFVTKNINTENIIVIILVLYSMVVGRVGNYLVEMVRKANLNLIHQADEAASLGDMKKIGILNFTGVIYSFFSGLILVSIGVILGALFLEPLIKFIHPNFDYPFGLAKYGILGVGFGSVLTLFINKETKWYFLVPFIIGGIGWLFITF